MTKLYITLKILIPIIVICLVALYAIIVIIKYKLDAKFKKNCYKCKCYKLYDVGSCGSNCRYKCTLKNRIDYHNMNDKDNFVKCDEFKSK